VNLAVAEHQDAFLSLEAESVELANGQNGASANDVAKDSDDGDNDPTSERSWSVRLLELENNVQVSLDAVDI
jgi:hypothetical protein